MATLLLKMNQKGLDVAQLKLQNKVKLLRITRFGSDFFIFQSRIPKDQKGNTFFHPFGIQDDSYCTIKHDADRMAS